MIEELRKHLYIKSTELTLNKSQAIQPSWKKKLVRYHADHEFDCNNPTESQKCTKKMNSDEIYKLKISNQHNSKHCTHADNEICLV